jgi:hypothetical protein
MSFLDEIEQYGIEHGGEPMTDNTRKFMSRLMGASDLFQNIEDRLRFPSLIRGEGGVVLKFKSPEDLRNAFQKRGIRISKKDSVEYFNATRDPQTYRPGLAGLSSDEITEISTEEFDNAIDSYYDSLRIKAFGIDEAE